MWDTFWRLWRTPTFHISNVVVWLGFSIANSTRIYSLQVESQHGYLYYLSNNLFWFMPWALITLILLAFSAAYPFEKGKVGRQTIRMFAVWHLLAAVYYPLVILGEIWVEPKLALDQFSSMMFKMLNGPIYFDYAFFAGVTFVCYSLIYYRQFHDEQFRNSNLQKQLALAELQALRAQLNPHFLFNTLNTVASLIRVDRKQYALTAISELSYLLRATLEQEQQQMIPVKQEIEFIRSYLHIQQLRFHDKLTVDLQINASCNGALIPAMLLQPLLENAVHHGVNSQRDQNSIRLLIDCEDGRLNISLHNDMVANSDHNGFGIGLKNTTERLDRLFQDRYSLDMNTAEQHVVTLLSLPLIVDQDTELDSNHD